jgi:hypothetical protein
MAQREGGRERERERPLEFDFAVAGNIWIRRDAWQTRQDMTRKDMSRQDTTRHVK